MAEQSTSASRHGCVDLVSQLTEQLQHLVVPYLYLFIVPLMRLMNAEDIDLRTAAAPVFAKLVTYLPLAQVLHLVLWNILWVNVSSLCYMRYSDHRCMLKILWPTYICCRGLTQRAHAHHHYIIMIAHMISRSSIQILFFPATGLRL